VPGLTVIRLVAALAVVGKLFSLVPMTLALNEPDIMRAPVVDAVPYPSDGAVLALAGLAVVAAALLAAGVWDRLAAGVLAAGIAAVLALDAQLYANHLYLLGLVLLIWAVAPLDARAASYRWLVSIVYGFAALTKLNVTYLSGLVLSANLGTGPVPLPEALNVWWLLSGLAILSVIVEAFLAVALWLPRWRREAVIVGVSLHAGILALMSPWWNLLVFGALMISLYSAFVADPAAGRTDRSSATRPAAAGSLP